MEMRHLNLTREDLSLQVPASEAEVDVKEIMKKCNESNPIDAGELE